MCLEKYNLINAFDDGSIQVQFESRLELLLNCKRLLEALVCRCFNLHYCQQLFQNRLFCEEQQF